MKIRFQGYLNKALGEVANKRDQYSMIEYSLHSSSLVDMEKYFMLGEDSSS